MVGSYYQPGRLDILGAIRTGQQIAAVPQQGVNMLSEFAQSPYGGQPSPMNMEAIRTLGQINPVNMMQQKPPPMDTTAWQNVAADNSIGRGIGVAAGAVGDAMAAATDRQHEEELLAKRHANAIALKQMGLSKSDAKAAKAEEKDFIAKKNKARALLKMREMDHITAKEFTEGLNDIGMGHMIGQPKSAFGADSDAFVAPNYLAPPESGEETAQEVNDYHGGDAAVPPPPGISGSSPAIMPPQAGSGPGIVAPPVQSAPPSASGAPVQSAQAPARGSDDWLWHQNPEDDIELTPTEQKIRAEDEDLVAKLGSSSALLKGMEKVAEQAYWGVDLPLPRAKILKTLQKYSPDLARKVAGLFGDAQKNLDSAGATLNWDQIMGLEAAKMMAEQLKGSTAYQELTFYSDRVAQADVPPDQKKAMLRYLTSLMDYEIAFRTRRARGMGSKLVGEEVMNYLKDKPAPPAQIQNLINTGQIPDFNIIQARENGIEPQQAQPAVNNPQSMLDALPEGSVEIEPGEGGARRFRLPDGRIAREQ